MANVSAVSLACLYFRQHMTIVAEGNEKLSYHGRK